MTDADRNRAILTAALEKVTSVGGEIAVAMEKLGEVQGELLLVAANYKNSEVTEAISLIEAIRVALDLDIGNINVLGSIISRYKGRF
jgi:hypothetical protein